ncbi:MAG: cytochrome c biogenesis CcdA family protein [Dehalococcoidia bacterium]|nr:cytochrome c biogenesis CcdA family protein [Dehalococcoidia bacterium]
MTEITVLGLLIAFAAGMVSCASPCVLPLVPAYVGYLSGTAADRSAPVAGARNSPFLHAVSFIAGFTTVFVTFGVSLGLIGFFLRDQQDILLKGAGSILIVMGLHMSGVITIPWLEQERGLRYERARIGYVRSFLVGSTFSVGWSPCIGPTLGGILALAATGETVWQGGIFLLVYSLGFAVPFLLMGLAFKSVEGFYRRARPLLPVVSFVGGAMMIVVGILIFTNSLINLNRYFNFGFFDFTANL